ncbi:MAG: hypothetical protein CSA38_01225 [Flavobacteriales bacterium]|nr:MAG: hypothetical protein CSA38_01225 [Flavobacteriales bacterium]
MRLFFLFLLLSALGFAQVKPKDSVSVGTKKSKDAIVVDAGKKDSVTIFKPTIYDYKIQRQYGAKSILDTVLTYNKTYIFTQYNNKDDFGKLRFANIGSGFNPLVYENNTKQNLSLLPTNKSYGIIGQNEVNYYNVKTPTTLFVLHNGMNEGMALNTTYTQNIGKQFNFAIEYMGLRSKGYYRNSLSASNNVVLASHYITKKQNYEIFTHFIHQNVKNEENGGIVADELFLNGDDSSRNRQNMQVNLEGSDSRFSYRRWYLTQQFSLFKSPKFPFKIRHTIFHQGNKYRYSQTATQNYFINDATNSQNELNASYPLNTQKFSNNFSNAFALVFDDEKIKFDGGVRYQMKNIGVENLVDKIKENRLGVLGNVQVKLWDKIELKSFLEYSNGKQWGNYLNSRNRFKLQPIKGYWLNGKVNFQSSAPSFNYLINRSIYKKFDYQWTDYQHQNILEVGGEMGLKWFDTKVFANYFRIDNFTYFNENFQPQQSGESLNVSQIGGEALFRYKDFYLNTRLLFQKNLTQDELLPMPHIIGRMNVYYQAKAFKNKAEVQTGIKTMYFSKFKSRNFMPIYNEYVLQGNATNFQIGNRPLIDAYFNLKVKRMFIFLEGQNMWSLIQHNQNYTAPHYPYSDFRINLGLVWYMIH